MISDPESKELFAMVKENNRMLKAMRRDAFIGGLLHIVWLVIIFVVVPYFAWLFIQPYIAPILAAYEQASKQSAEVSVALDELKQLQNSGFLEQFKNTLQQFGGGSGN